MFIVAPSAINSGGRLLARVAEAAVAADGAPVADLRAAHRPRRLGERREQLGERRAHGLRVGEAGAQPDGAVLAAPALQLGHLVQIDQGGRAAPVEVQVDHHVGPALDRDRVGLLGADRERLVEGVRREDVHDGQG